MSPETVKATTEMAAQLDAGSQFMGNNGPGELAAAVIAILLVWTVLKAAMITMALWCNFNWPELCRLSSDIYQDRKWRCMLVGAVNLFSGVLLVLFLLATKILALPGLFGFVCLLLVVLLGFTAAYRSFGLRLGVSEGPGAGARQVLLGGITAETAFMLPILGQILALATILRGTGAASMALMEQRRRRRAAKRAAALAAPVVLDGKEDTENGSS